MAEETQKSFKIPFIISIIFNVILIVILIIEVILVLKKRKEKYNCPCYKD